MRVYYSALQVLLGLQLAYDMNAAFVLNMTALQSNGDHGSYPWFDEMTGISYNEYTLERVIAGYSPEIIDVCPASAVSSVAVTQQCNVLFNIMSYHCCSYMHSGIEHDTKHDCFTFECHKGLLDMFRPLTLQKYAYANKLQSISTQYTVSLVFDTAEYNVAVHIRTGDVKLHIGNADYFRNMIQSTVHTHLSHMPVHMYYIGQFGGVSDNTNTMTESPTADWSFLNTLHTNTSFYNPDEKTALHHFIHADMTIITGSSFPYIAIAVSDKPIYVTAIPKTGVHDFLYDPDNSYTFDLDEHGGLETSQAEALAKAAQQLKTGRFSFNQASVAVQEAV
jgi:hypothetical protein